MTISGIRTVGNQDENLKTSFIVNFSNSLTSAEEFVAELSELHSDINAEHGTKIVDAKSLMGFINMSHLPVKVTINTIDEDELKLFNKICKKYKVKYQ